MAVTIHRLLEVLMAIDDGYILEGDRGLVLRLENAYTVSVSKDGEGYHSWTTPIIAEDPDGADVKLSESLSSTCSGENADKVQSASDLIELILEVKSKGKEAIPGWNCSDESCCGRGWYYE